MSAPNCEIIYAGMSDDEILHIACEASDLREEARGTLNGELRKRKLTEKYISEYREQLGRFGAERWRQIKSRSPGLSSVLQRRSAGSEIFTPTGRIQRQNGHHYSGPRYFRSGVSGSQRRLQGLRRPALVCPSTTSAISLRGRRSIGCIAKSHSTRNRFCLFTPSFSCCF